MVYGRAQNWFKEVSRKTLVIVILVAALVVVDIPTAIWFGAASAIFDSPEEGVISFFVVLGIAVVLLIGQFVPENLKELRKTRQRL